MGVSLLGPKERRVQKVGEMIKNGYKLSDDNDNLAKCEDGSRPTCADGSKPQKVKGEPPCPEGRPKTCADGSQPSSVNGRKCPKGRRFSGQFLSDDDDNSGKCQDGSRPTCADGSKPKRRKGEAACPEGCPKTCSDGSSVP